MHLVNLVVISVKANAGHGLSWAVRVGMYGECRRKGPERARAHSRQDWWFRGTIVQATDHWLAACLTRKFATATVMRDRLLRNVEEALHADFVSVNIFLDRIALI